MRETSLRISHRPTLDLHRKIHPLQFSKQFHHCITISWSSKLSPSWRIQFKFSPRPVARVGLSCVTGSPNSSFGLRVMCSCFSLKQSSSLVGGAVDIGSQEEVKSSKRTLSSLSTFRVGLLGGDFFVAGLGEPSEDWEFDGFCVLIISGEPYEKAI